MWLDKQNHIYTISIKWWGSNPQPLLTFKTFNHDRQSNINSGDAFPSIWVSVTGISNILHHQVHHREDEEWGITSSCPVRQVVKSSPFHGEVMGSIPIPDSNIFVEFICNTSWTRVRLPPSPLVPVCLSNRWWSAPEIQACSLTKPIRGWHGIWHGMIGMKEKVLSL